MELGNDLIRFGKTGTIGPDWFNFVNLLLLTLKYAIIDFQIIQTKIRGGKGVRKDATSKIQTYKYTAKNCWISTQMFYSYVMVSKMLVQSHILPMINLENGTQYIASSYRKLKIT